MTWPTDWPSQASRRVKLCTLGPVEVQTPIY
jgi:hypothetical protein